MSARTVTPGSTDTESTTIRRPVDKTALATTPDPPRPSPLGQALEFIDELVGQPTARVVSPGPNHLAIWQRLCRTSDTTGKLVTDAQHAAVAIEHDCTLVTTDAHFNRFHDLRWHATRCDHLSRPATELAVSRPPNPAGCRGPSR